jgi:hypothetical protein
MIFDHPVYRAEPKEGTLRFDAEALKAGRTTSEVLDSRCPSRAAVSQIAPRVVQVTEGQAVSRYQDPYRAELADRNARQLGASNASVL